MRRRTVLAAIASAAAFQSFVATAQQAGRIYRLGFVVQQPRAKYADLLDELGRLGFVEGGNLDVDLRGCADRRPAGTSRHDGG